MEWDISDVTYNEEDHQVWKTLYDAVMPLAEQHACKAFLHGLTLLHISGERIPSFSQIRKGLSPATGWEPVKASGLETREVFFKAMADAKFPTVPTIRPKDQLEYIEEPDIFHDAFGHIPCQTNPHIGNFMRRSGELADYAGYTEEVLEDLARLYWYTVEFGLIEEDGVTKIYGSGILSSSKEIVYSVGDEPELRRADLRGMLDLPFRTDKIQPVYWVLHDLSELDSLIEDYAELKGFPKGEPVA